MYFVPKGRMETQTSGSLDLGKIMGLKLGGGGTNRRDIELNLSGSWQQGHSATYNTPSRF